MEKVILITGGAGFIGSHLAEYYANKGNAVIVFDNLSRTKLLGKSRKNALYNWNYLRRYDNIDLVQGDVRDFEQLEKVGKNADIIIHTAGQTAVTTSITNPREDFSTNVVGTFNVLEVARKSDKHPVIIYCSTNKVYGENVNEIGIVEKRNFYIFKDDFKNGISETFGIDLCEHTPYGCSKLSADLYMQDYARLYGLKVGVFRMSCIYGPRQFGVEDQGWVAWFAIATLSGKPITIFGDGKQIRDVLYVTDLIKAFDAFVQSDLRQGVFNIGGGKDNTLSLLELLDFLEKMTGLRSKVIFTNWRPSDQKVYISDILRAKKSLNWEPKVTPKEGIKKLVDWVNKNKNIF